MSIPFNQQFTGLVQQYEQEIGATRDTVANNTNLLKEFTAKANSAIDDYLAIAIQTAGKWKFDDSNHSKFPEIVTDLVQGQQKYTFNVDEQGNLVLDIYKVYTKQDGMAYVECEAVDSDFTGNAPGIVSGLNSQGVPYQYDKSANVILLDPVPNADVTDGLKVSINREASYFTYSDTTKKPGVPGIHHKYFYLRPALDYARRNSLESYVRIEAEFLKLEAEIKEYFAKRDKDDELVITTPVINSI